MNNNDWEVRYAGSQDIQPMLDLNYKIYPDEWHVEADYVKNILGKNKKVYRVLTINNQIKGIYSLFPLAPHIYERVLNGELHEQELNDYIIGYPVYSKVCLYLISIIVDIRDSNSSQYTKTLLKDMKKQLKHLDEEQAPIQEIGAFAISEGGKRILNKIGFNNSGHMELEGETYQVFRGNLEKIRGTIQFD